MNQMDSKTSRKMNFYFKQFAEAFSPAHFVHLNPEVLSKTLETGGANLISGMKQFLEDLERGKGRLNIKTTDLDAFQIGENIACTPGKVIYQNDLMQLIHYTPTTEKTYENPVLMIPPWVNKYYILDLQQENSLVKWLVDRGMSVFMISWVNATAEHRKKEFSDYMTQGPLAALKIINKVTGSEKANLLGYCIGGTLLSCTLAYLAKKKMDSIASATFLTTLLDFSEPGDLGVFMDEDQIYMLEKHMETKGYMDGNVLSNVFSLLRSKDMIWSAFVKHYLKNEKPKAFDLLYWNSDAVHIPMNVHSFYLRNMYLNNLLIEPGKVKLAGVPLDLSKIKTPSYFLAADHDHLVPWKSCYKSSQFYGGPVQFVLSKSGHVAGVVNPPHKNKYGFWKNTKNPKDPEKYLSKAVFHEGSWWNDWICWLQKYSGSMLPVERNKNHKIKVIENAPGSYVKASLQN